MKKAIAALGGLAALSGLVLFMTHKPPQKPKEHYFPAGFRVTGDPATGRLCHKVYRCDPEDRDIADCTLLKSHFIDGKDFRNLTEAEAKAALKADTEADASEAGIAECREVPPDGILFRNALAQPHCEDCGGECHYSTCPATFFAPTGQCPLGGTTCSVTVYCCGSCWPMC